MSKENTTVDDKGFSINIDPKRRLTPASAQRMGELLRDYFSTHEALAVLGDIRAATSVAAGHVLDAPHVSLELSLTAPVTREGKVELGTSEDHDAAEVLVSINLYSAHEALNAAKAYVRQALVDMGVTVTDP